MSTRFLACASVLATLAGVAPAQDRPAKAEPTTTTVQVQKTRLQRIGADIVGVPLVTPGNEPLGQIEDLVVHPKGEISFLQCSAAGALDVGSVLYPVPWDACERNESGHFVLPIEPAKFRGQPRYDEAPLTDMESWQTAANAYRHITAEKASPAEAAVSFTPAKKMFLASDLRARTIENPDGQKVATVKEIVADPKAGRIAYVVLAVGGSSAGGGEKTVAVPWEALKVIPDKQNPEFERLTLTTTAEELAKAPEFQATTEGWAKASDPAYVVQVYEFYSLPPYAIVEVPVEEKGKPDEEK